MCYSKQKIQLLYEKMLPVHVEVWMRGKQFQNQLEPFQRLVLDLHSVFAGNLSSKLDMERALHTFRHKYYNQFLFENKTPGQQVQKFIKRLKEFEDLKKPSKKDLTSLYEDLCKFRNIEWIGGHCDGVPVLSQWKPNLLECPHLYKKWYSDEVQAIQKQFNLETNKCIVSGQRHIWKVTDVPASVDMISQTVEPTQQAKNILEQLQKYLVVPRTAIMHISDSLLQMYTSVAVDQDTPVDEQLHNIYRKRIPEEYDSVSNFIATKKQCKQLESDLKDAESRAENNNALYKECALSLDRISTRLSQLERTLDDYQHALRDRDKAIQHRDNIIRQLQQQRPHMLPPPTYTNRRIYNNGF